MSTEPKAFAEQLDATRDGEEFAQVIHGLFAGLERTMDAEEWDA